MNVSKNVVSVVTALSAACYSVTNTARAAGGLEAAATATGNEILGVILGLMPIIMLALLIIAAFMVASRKFGAAAVGSVLVGAWIAGNADLVLRTFGVTI